MYHHDELTTAKDDYCFAKPGEIYAVYLPKGDATELNLGDSKATFTVQWFNPRKGGDLAEGSVTQIKGPGKVSLGNPPDDTGKDWVSLVQVK